MPATMVAARVPGGELLDLRGGPHQQSWCIRLLVGAMCGHRWCPFAVCSGSEAPQAQAGVAPQWSSEQTSESGLRFAGPKRPRGYPSGTQ